MREDQEKQKYRNCPYLHSIINFVDKILTITKDDGYLENPTKKAKVRDYEKQIDQLIYRFYGLTPEKIKIVEKP